MARSLSEMVTQGKGKLERKASSMTASWNAAKSRMKAHYGEQPFGQTRKANFNREVDAATHRSDPNKWAENYAAKMAE
ncbi:MAG: hypothetical protein Q8O40_04410 [Chloroflexota bacterium]|nr:hypothetical protein [Chloroflexota bacterium]